MTNALRNICSTFPLCSCGVVTHTAKTHGAKRRDPQGSQGPCRQALGTKGGAYRLNEYASWYFWGSSFEEGIHHSWTGGLGAYPLGRG